MDNIRVTPETKKIAKEQLEGCPYLRNIRKTNATLKELLEQASIEHKAVLDYLKDK